MEFKSTIIVLVYMGVKVYYYCISLLLLYKFIMGFKSTIIVLVFIMGFKSTIIV